MISDFGVSVESGARVNVEFPISGVEDVSDVTSLESPFVLGSVPELKKQSTTLYIHI